MLVSLIVRQTQEYGDAMHRVGSWDVDAQPRNLNMDLWIVVIRNCA